MSLLRKLEMAVDFSTSEKLIATYILKNGPDVLNMSTSQLAKATYTSPATITRLCQKLEYKGYNDFKIALSAQLQYTFDRNSETNPNFPFKKRDTIHTIKHSIATLAKDSINLTVNNIDNDILAKSLLCSIKLKLLIFMVSQVHLELPLIFNIRCFESEKMFRLHQWSMNNYFKLPNQIRIIVPF